MQSANDLAVSKGSQTVVGIRRSMEAQVHFITPDRQLQKREPLWIRAHQEESGVRIITLTSDGGNQTLRRGHIGGGHQCPDGGPFLAGPHIHYPTNVYQEIGVVVGVVPVRGQSTKASR